MRRFIGWGFLLVTAWWLTGCATGEPRLQGTWKSNKVPMRVEMVKVTTVETVKVGKGKHKTTKKVPKTVTVAKTKSAPPYMDLVLRYRGSNLIIEVPSGSGDKPLHSKLSYEVVASDERSVTLDIKEPTTSVKKRIHITFEGPNRYTVDPAGGVGWKEYYVRVDGR